MTAFEAFAVAATGLNTLKSISDGQAQARAQERQAAYLQSQADYQAQVAQSQEASLRHNQSRQLAQMRAVLAGRGVDIGSGSPLLNQEQAAADAEFQALLLRSTGQAQAWDLAQRANLARASAAEARAAIPLDAGTTLLSGLSRARNPKVPLFPWEK